MKPFGRCSVFSNYLLAVRLRLWPLLLICGCLLAGGVFFLQKREAEEGRAPITMERFLRIAMEPVGSTMYIWGGGWDDRDGGAGEDGTRIGVSPQWRSFYESQDETYDFQDYRFHYGNGLDCSGFVGWVIYNLRERESGRKGYVCTSTDMAETYARQGWGDLYPDAKRFLPGDIVSMEGHVWISLGTCGDGSVLLVHSSPPGISVCGTKAEGEETSTAVELATRYMQENHPRWQAAYPDRAVEETYVTRVDAFRWNAADMEDAARFQSMSGEEVMEWLKGVYKGNKNS